MISSKIIVFALLCIILKPSWLYSSDFGVSGLIDTPTARMSADGVLTMTSAIQSRTNSYAITYQATPWLEGTFRYTGFNDNSLTYDRNYEVKVRLLKENEIFPELGVGIRDIAGTGLWGSEYLVASKNLGNIDLTFGVGWGRLSGDGRYKNPFISLSDSFASRDQNVGFGGLLASKTFFSGEKVGFFGGFSYHLNTTLPMSIMFEYNPDNYQLEVARGGLKPNSPISAAIKWNLQPGLALTLSHQHNQEWGIELSAAIDTKSSPPRPSYRMYQSSLDLYASDLPPGINKSVWYDMLLFDAERSGLLVLEASIDEFSKIATIVMGNLKYSVWTDALNLMVNLADLHLPKNVKAFKIVPEEEGHRVNSIYVPRPSLNYRKNQQIVDQEISIEPARPLSFIQHRTNFMNKKLLLDINLSSRFQLFDPDDPARYQLYGKIGLSMMLPGNWVLSGALDKDITNNFNESKRQSNSVIQRVRSDIIKYLNEGETGLDSLYIQKRGNLSANIFYRVYGGILESMYSGAGAELLYQPFESRLAFGISGNIVRQRDFSKNFSHLSYQTETFFSSAYWASPFYNLDVAIHAGKYLAKDFGATLELRRTFDNGWMVGLWATKTDVSAEDFGEGSFDKGLFFKIPLNGFLGMNSRTSYITRVRPVQRDGGQYLEDFTGRIWWDIRAIRYDVFNQANRKRRR